MADTAFRHDDNLTVELWSARLFKEALKNLFFGKFVGAGANSLIQTDTDLTKDVGDKITFGLRTRLTGQGRSDDQDLEGYEEPLAFHDFAATVHLRANAVKAKGKMSQRRTKYNVQEQARLALADWMTELIDNDTVLTLSGLANPAITDDDGTIVSAVSHSTNRKWYGGQTAAGVLNSESGDGSTYDDSYLGDASTADGLNYLFGTLVISAVKRKAQMATPKVRPVSVDGGKHYVMFIHPLQAKSLKGETAWNQAQREANWRGSKNPIFTGALGMWDGVIIHEYERILTRQGASGDGPSTYFESGDPAYYTSSSDRATIARALFCGAQAGVHAYAQNPGWYRKNFQYGREPGIATDLIYVSAKPRFDSEDYGVITVDTCVVPD